MATKESNQMRKKSILSWMTIALMSFVCISFAACGGDDENNPGGGGDSGGTFKGAKRVFGDNLVKAFASSEGTRYEFTYDANGFMTHVKTDMSKGYEYSISYQGSTITVSRYRDGSLNKTWTGTIGSSGFLSKTAGEKETLNCTYDNSGHLSKFLIYEDGDDIDTSINLTWQNGDIVSGNREDKPTTYTITYESGSQNKITNDAGLPDLEHFTTMSIDVESFLFYGGFLGFGPSHLPIGSAYQRSNKSSVDTYAWEFDNKHRPIRMQKTEVTTETGGSPYTSTKVYTWEY